MDVLALYDIHGNIDALDAVLADPRVTEPDAVVVGGDAVPGPFARATLTRKEMRGRVVAPRSECWTASRAVIRCLTRVLRSERHSSRTTDHAGP
jgi:hypothetical protein